MAGKRTRGTIRPQIYKRMRMDSNTLRQPDSRLYTALHAINGEERREISFCIPLSMWCVMAGDGCGWVCGGDPKGVGAMTTSRRYSRKRHRQTFSLFNHADSASSSVQSLIMEGIIGNFSSPRGTSYPFSIIGQLNFVDMDVEKDKKGLCYILSHKRCGYHESMFVTKRELIELSEKIDNVLNS